MEHKNEMHPLLQAFLTVAPYINSLFTEDLSVGLCDTEKFLISTPGKTFALDVKPGDPLVDGDAIQLAIKTNKIQRVFVPEHIFGFPILSTAIPLHDEKGKVVGGVGIGVSMEEQYRALSGISSNLSESVKQVTTTIQELDSSSTKLSVNMKLISEQSNAVMQSVKEIEKVVTMVRSISEHSKILGINASIEAAHAGDKGRGFAVVAEEMQKMAKNSSNYTDVIRKSVLHINSLIENLNASLTKIGEETSNQATVTEELAATMKDINDSANHLADVTKQRLEGKI